jgi:RNA polymerase sigma-70 factor (ECF subfamily)
MNDFGDFGRLLEKEIPRLRRYAFALTRNMSRADDLVQDSLVRAIAKQRYWQYGTNLRAWIFTIMHNQNVNVFRRSVRRGITVDDRGQKDRRSGQSNPATIFFLRAAPRSSSRSARLGGADRIWGYRYFYYGA